MMKLFKLRTLILILLIGNTGFVYSQDTTKKANTVKSSTAKPTVTNTAKKPVVVKQQPTKPTTLTPTPVVTKPVRQAPDPALMNDKSLYGQYQYLLTKVYHYQQPLVAALWKNYNDTLNITRRKLKEAEAKIAVQAQKIDTLQTEVGTKADKLSTAKAKVDEISFLGIPLNKTTYNWIMWGLVIGLGALAAIVIIRSGANIREARYRTKLYNELDEEYRAHKVKANEKEKKLARELQTERNKLDELLGR
ncbi:hypothetical protein [Mucilaginibacter segetis]|uniref:Uncharacterized protein n=1 Tax=Mucilaginibacter segetis TaxID=2793071 RepID=A0A934PQU5_9SPHI|nr:hypothetical protein [Mucilaginibacter segetis]MBK0377760.1 hypothetical protein [Mucilaginibacter segetis]